MNLYAAGIGIKNGLRLGVLFLALTLVACSRDVVSTPTEPANATVAAEVPDATNPEAFPPAASEPIKPQPVADSPIENAPPGITVLKPGQSAQIDDSTTLHYVRLVSDSRCPVNAQCVWAGEVTIELTLESAQDKKTFTISDRVNTTEAMGFGIELISIDRAHLVNIRAWKL